MPGTPSGASASIITSSDGFYYLGMFLLIIAGWSALSGTALYPFPLLFMVAGVACITLGYLWYHTDWLPF